MTLSPIRARSLHPSDRVRGLVSDLARSRRPLSLHELTHFIARADLTREDLAPFVVTKAASYVHRELFRSPYLELGCIGWRRGHHTPIHDHHDSVCCVVVLAGVLTNTAFVPAGRGKAVRGETHRLRPAELLALDRGAVHRMGNEHDADLITLHVYSPPLIPMHARIRRESATDTFCSPR